MNATQSLAHNLNGWISLALNSDVDEALRMLDDPSMGRDLDALMCKARIFGRQGRGKKKLDQLNEAIALESWFTPALVEKGKSFLNEGEWEQAEEVRRSDKAIASGENHNCPSVSPPPPPPYPPLYSSSIVPSPIAIRFTHCRWPSASSTLHRTPPTPLRPTCSSQPSTS